MTRKFPLPAILLTPFLMLIALCSCANNTKSTSAATATAPATAPQIVSTPAPPSPPPLPLTLADQWRKSLDLTGPGWKLWRDTSAKWRTDHLFLPPVDLSTLPINPPTPGWQNLYAAGNGQKITPPSPVTATQPTTQPAAAPPTIDPQDVKQVRVPGTVEEYLWGVDGDPYGSNGNYQGVSWWWRDFTIPADWQSKRLILKFNACRLRAEVFVNEQLVGYDTIGNTPFDVDITKAGKIGQVNHLAVRITNPNGHQVECNFDYGDYRSMPWGDTSIRIPSSHGFGGITGNLTLLALDPVEVADIFVKNKPTPSPSHSTDADIDITLNNTQPKEIQGTLKLKIFEKDTPEKILYEQTWPDVPLSPGKTTLTKPVSAPEAKIWDLDTPNLYQCEASFEVPPTNQSPAIQDAKKVTYGYRWFTADAVGTPDAVLRFNGRRIMIRSAISWGYWPINGIFPTPELADRQTKLAKSLGLNMLHMHRTIADPLLLQKADEQGLLLYCEPGGYKNDLGDENARRMATEKLMRMVQRDRNHPSIVAYGMINEIWVHENVVYPEYLRDIVAAHKLDPSRTIVLASGQKSYGEPDPRGSWMMPYDTQRKETGWYDEHHAGGPGVYNDGLYRNPEAAHAGNEGLDEDVLCEGEEGAIPTLDPLETMLKQYAAAGRKGWDGDDNIRLAKNYNQWLDDHHARDAFPSLDDLCHSTGDLAYYHQGRIIENARLGNKVDIYVINGWDSSKLDNHSGIVDPFRDPKGNPKLLSYFNQPLYVAIKIRTTVTAPGDSTIVDLGLVNEKNIKGPHTLELTVTDPQGKQLSQQQWPVTVDGGETFGQYLQENINIKVGDQPGYTTLTAKLLDPQKNLIAQGKDRLYVADYRSVKIPPGGALLDSTGITKRFLKTLNYDAIPYSELKSPTPFVVAIDSPYMSTSKAAMTTLLDRVKNDGTTLIILQQADRWATILKKQNIVQYDGLQLVANIWQGGQYFVLNSPLFAGLPQAQAMNWEYQMVAQGNQPPPGRRGLYLKGDDAAVGCYNSTDTEMATVVGSVRYGAGKILFSTLPLFAHLSSPEPNTAVVKRIFVNYLANTSMPQIPTTQSASQPASSPAP